MFALNAIVFSALKPLALALAIVNLIVIAAVLVCLIVLFLKIAEREKTASVHHSEEDRSFFDKTE